MAKPKVLILTSNYGNGHIQAARAIQERFILEENADVVVRDLYQETNPRIHEWTKKLYLKSYTRSGRHLYRLFYYSSQEITKRNVTVFAYGYSKLSKIIAEEQPDAIINTFPTFAVPYYRKKTNAKIPTFNVVTDYCLHHSWVQPFIDKYYVAIPQLQSQLMEKGISELEIAITGIPVQHQFEQVHDRKILLKKYQLNPNLKTILIVAGAYGVTKEMKDICKSLKDDENLQILIVCGKNSQLCKQLQWNFQREQNIHIFGYVTQMAELLQLATCVITKPGGMILSEALAANVPIVLPRAIPGQEKENALFFEDQGAAIFSEKWEQLVCETRELVHNEEKLQKVKASLSKIHVPQATESIVNDVMQKLSLLNNAKYNI